MAFINGLIIDPVGQGGSKFKCTHLLSGKMVIEMSGKESGCILVCICPLQVAYIIALTSPTMLRVINRPLPQWHFVLSGQEQHSNDGSVSLRCGS